MKRHNNTRIQLLFIVKNDNIKVHVQDNRQVFGQLHKGNIFRLNQNRVKTVPFVASVLKGNSPRVKHFVQKNNSRESV